MRSKLCLFLAAFAVCAGLMAQATPPLPFSNVTAGVGISVPPITGFNGYGRGSAWDDFDGDGDMDLFAPGGNDHGIWMFWNNGAAGFSSQVIQPSAQTNEHHLAAVSADFDNDGDQDVFLCIENGADKLFVNQGGGVFVDEAAARGLASTGPSYCATWGDFDRDGWLDLYVGNHVTDTPNADRNQLYRNDGTGNFIDVSVASGADAPGAALSVVWHDVDQDGWPDIHVGNDKGDSFPPNALMHNKRTSYFVDEAVLARANAPIDCMGVTVGDMHNDGDWDVFLSNNQLGHVMLEWDAVQRRYKAQASWYDVASSYGLQTNQVGWGTNFFDYDCDAVLDLFIMHGNAPNRLYRGTPGTTAFIDETFTRNVGTVMPAGESCCVVDYDDDGDLDLWMPGRTLPAQLIRNPGPEANWIKFKLEGTVSNRDAFGAVVICRTPSHTQRRMKTSGESFLSDGDKRVHFGLGDEIVVAEVEIRWPSGTVSFLHNVASNQLVSVVEPRFTVTGSMLPGTINPVHFTLPSDAGLTYIAGVTIDTSVETPLGDGRFIRFNLLDPIYQATTAPGNWDFTNSMGTLDANGSATMNLFLPPFPQLSGFPLYFVAGTGDNAYAWGLKSLIAPNKFYIQ